MYFAGAYAVPVDLDQPGPCLIHGIAVRGLSPCPQRFTGTVQAGGGLIWIRVPRPLLRQDRAMNAYPAWPARALRFIAVLPEGVSLDVARRLISPGFPVGPSSGLNFAAALEYQRRFPQARTAVTVFPDRMERYFSTDLFRDRS